MANSDNKGGSQTVQGNLSVTGKIVVNGLVDPTGVELTGAGTGQMIGMFSQTAFPVVSASSPSNAPLPPVPADLPLPPPASLVTPIPYKVDTPRNTDGSLPGLFIRTGPTVDSPVVGTAHKGDIIPVTGGPVFDPSSGAIFVPIIAPDGTNAWIPAFGTQHAPGQSDDDEPFEYYFLLPLDESPERLQPFSDSGLIVPPGEVLPMPSMPEDVMDSTFAVDQTDQAPLTGTGDENLFLQAFLGLNSFNLSGDSVSFVGPIGADRDLVPVLTVRPGANSISIRGAMEITSDASGTRSQFSGGLIRSIDADGHQTNVSGQNIQVSDVGGRHQALVNSTSTTMTGPEGQSNLLAGSLSVIGPVTNQMTSIVGGVVTPGIDDMGEIGTDNKRWSRVRATAVVTGDLELRDDKKDAHWVILEERDMLVAVNRKTGKRFKILLEEAVV